MKVWLVTVQTFVVGTNEIVFCTNTIFATEELAKKRCEEEYEEYEYWDTVAEYEEMEVKTS